MRCSGFGSMASAAVPIRLTANRAYPPLGGVHHNLNLRVAGFCWNMGTGFYIRGGYRNL